MPDDLSVALLAHSLPRAVLIISAFDRCSGSLANHPGHEVVLNRRMFAVYTIAHLFGLQGIDLEPHIGSSLATRGLVSHVLLSASFSLLYLRQLGGIVF